MWRLAVLGAVIGCGRRGFDHFAPDTALDPDAHTAAITRVQVLAPGYQRAAQVSIPAVDVAGDLVLAAVYWNTVGTSVEVTDTLGLAWTALPSQHSITCMSDIQMWFAIVAQSGSNTFTVTQSAGTMPLGMYIVEYSGIDPVNPVEATTGMLAPGASNAMTAGTLATTNNTLVVALFNDVNGNGTMVPGSGYTAIARDTPFYSMLEESMGTPGPIAPDATLPSGISDDCWVATAAAFQPR
jgi:hypothetical protein